MQNKKYQRDQAHFEKRKEQYDKLLTSLRKDDRKDEDQSGDK